MAILEIVKSALRISTDTFDTAEITPIIDACKTDLLLAGVVNIDDTDSLTQRAIVLYAKGHFGFSEEQERYLKVYESLKKVLVLMSDYNTETEA